MEKWSATEFETEKAQLEALAPALWVLQSDARVLTPDYRSKLVELARENGAPLVEDGTEFAQLGRMLESEGIDVVEPADRGVLPKLPYLHPVSTVLTSRFLIDCDGTAVHSRVHRVPDLVRVEVGRQQDD